MNDIIYNTIENTKRLKKCVEMKLNKNKCVYIIT